MIVHGPSRQATKAARRALESAVPTAEFHEAVADFSSQSEVSDLAAEVQDRFGTLDVLVNNAAAVSDTWSADGVGVESTFAVNHLAPYLLTRRLLPAFERSDAGRVVIVASESHRKARWNSDDLGQPGRYDRFDAYARSKLANLLFNAELARRLADAGSKVTTNAAHPGTLRTSLFRPRNLAERVVIPIINLRAVSPEAASAGIAWLATSDDMAGQSGGYYHKGRTVEPSPVVADEQNGFELWKLSAELTDLPIELDG